MKVAAIVQARMGSVRLPGKVMLPLQDKTVLGHVLTRLKQSYCLNEILVATSDLPGDLRIVEEAARHGVRAYRGSERNVLERFYRAALDCQTDLIVRITADCPLIDPGIIDAMLQQYQRDGASFDYMSNTLIRSFPRGLDVEIFTADALEQAYRQAEREDEKEHVTPYLYRHPERFRLCSYTNPTDCSHYRWTLDTKEDWLFIQEVYRRVYPENPSFRWPEIISLLEQEPELARMNGGIRQKETGR